MQNQAAPTATIKYPASLTHVDRGIGANLAAVDFGKRAALREAQLHVSGAELRPGEGLRTLWHATHYGKIIFG